MSEKRNIEFAYTSKEVVAEFTKQFPFPYPFLPLSLEKTHYELQRMIDAGWNTEKILKRCVQTPVFPKQGFGVPIFNLILHNEPIIDVWGDEKTRKAFNRSLELG